MTSREPHIKVNDLTMAYGDFVIQRDLTFDIGRGEIFVIMGGSGCGKSTLLRHLIGLKRPARGSVHYERHQFLGHRPGRARQPDAPHGHPVPDRRPVGVP